MRAEVISVSILCSKIQFICAPLTVAILYRFPSYSRRSILASIKFLTFANLPR